MVCLIPAVVFIGIAQQHIVTGLTFGAERLGGYYADFTMKTNI